MIFLRSLIFQIYFIIISFAIATLFLPLLLFPKKIDLVGKIWAKSSYLGLKYICNITMLLEGEENLPPPPYIIASKHQSVIETIMFWIIFKKPSYILKKQLTNIPLYGLYLIKMGMIIIDRSKISTSLKKIINDSAIILKDNGTIVIFPEGTRTVYNILQDKYKSGITSLYLKMNVAIVPIALNTGYFWARNNFLKRPGKFIIKILPPILPGLSKTEFEEKIYNDIEYSSFNLKLHNAENDSTFK